MSLSYIVVEPAPDGGASNLGRGGDGASTLNQFVKSVRVFGFRVWGLGFRVRSLGLRVWGALKVVGFSGFRSSGFKILAGFRSLREFRVFRVSGS